MTTAEAQATRHDVAEGARRHYLEVSREAAHWSSVIPAAIDAWEREPKLLDCLRVFVRAEDMTGWDLGVWLEAARELIDQAEQRS